MVPQEKEFLEQRGFDRENANRNRKANSGEKQQHVLVERQMKEEKKEQYNKLRSCGTTIRPN